MTTSSAAVRRLLPLVGVDLVSCSEERETTPADIEDRLTIELSLSQPEKFAVLFDRHAQTVHRYPDFGPDAERATVRQWLLGIATNLLRRHARTEERRYRALARAAPDHHDPAITEGTIDRVDAQAMRAELAAALAELKPADRDVLLLSAWGATGVSHVPSCTEP